MKRFSFALYLTALILAIGVVNAQNVVYDNNAEVRKVAAFTGVEVSGGIALYLAQGTEQAVAVSASDAKYVGKIKTVVEGGVLKIRLESGSWNKWNWDASKIKAYVTVSKLTELEATGAASITATGELNVDKLEMDISGASTFKGSVKGNVLDVDASGASTVILEGSVSNVSLDASGASNIKGFNMIAVICDVDASGASQINITATKELKLDASGASSIRYKGDGLVKHLDVSGASSVRKQE